MFLADVLLCNTREASLKITAQNQHFSEHVRGVWFLLALCMREKGMQSTQMRGWWGVEGNSEGTTVWQFCLGLEPLNLSIKWYEG